MNNLLVGITSLLIGYLAGSVSFPRIVTSLVSPGLDLEGTMVPIEGSDEKIPMNAVSATSVRFNLGSKYGCLSSFLDMVKVAIPVAAFHFLLPDTPADILAAMGGIIGHNWPIYYNFRGGYGHSAIYGALFVIEWTAVPVSFLGTAILYFIFRQVQIASMGGIFLLIPWFWYLDYDAYGLLYAVICSAAYFIKILPDFQSSIKLEKKKSDPEEEGEGG